ncbi:MAG TPA: SDR family NAD(P)-dependent oxidoreductase, partial [Steroidobacteraceae bacterium]|nr:SDR family NAD(P)-dependent oxidoreductase [Steroidobacteraceae bacterium]
MKTALVTGAAQGVGLKTSETLAALGFRVVLVDLQSTLPLAARLSAAGTAAIGVPGDVASEPFVQQLADRVQRDYGALDALVNNAGISLIASAEQTTSAQWRRVIDVNLFGPFLLCKYLGSQMLERRRGSIVNVASVAGLAGVSHRSAYNASKHGLIG